MQLTWRRAELIAALVYLALFLLRFITTGPGSTMPLFGGEPDILAEGPSTFELSRKSYATSKNQAVDAVGGTSPGLGRPDNQKYEKVASLTQVTRDFDADRKRVDELIRLSAGVIQHERAVGLKGRRALQLGIGVPPDKFDAFIEATRGIGKSFSVEIVKSDKTNEYLQLRAKRQTLEKARAALEDLRAGGGSIEERVTVQNRLTEIEQQIQDLGVSLGEFDSPNELCTVKLSLRERPSPAPWSVARRASQAFQMALTDNLMLGLGFFALMAGLWLGTLALRQARRMWAGYASTRSKGPIKRRNSASGTP